MSENKTVIKIEIHKKIFEFHCDNDSSLGSIHDALMQMKGWVINKIIESHNLEVAELEKSKQVEISEKEVL